MQALPTTIGTGFDGDVDPGLERPDEGRAVGAEAAAHALLRMIGEHPGQMGRVRAARIVGGHSVPYRSEEDAATFAAYAVDLDWPLREITRLVDALVSGGLVHQTSGPRPVLVLTRPGHRTLDALDGIGSGPL